MKYCSGCHQEKPIDEFAKNKARMDGVQTYCRSCKALYDSKYYRKNITSHKQRVKNYFIRNKLKLWEYLKCHPCVDCGVSNPIVLEFDHITKNKRQSISFMVNNMKCSWETLEKEINKCEVRCANCHRIKTANELKWKKFLGR